MKSIHSKAELMAPVGSFAALQAAIQGGADSVYFGIGHLNMRSHSSRNFKPEDLPKILTDAHAHQLNAYLALNTVIYDKEIVAMKQLVEYAAESGIDAIIGFDPAVIHYAHELNIPVHLSTQTNVSNVESLQFYTQYADTVVLARELNLPQIEHIINQIKKRNITGPSGKLITVEIFIHGALCMAIAGKCYLSLHDRNKSANRGECLQICRRSYTVHDNETGRAIKVDNQYLMSPKDLCTIGFLNKILDAGVGLLKIEGRARSPEYVYTVTNCYRQAIDAYYNRSYHPEKIRQWQKELRSVFNRGFWEGSYLGKNISAWSSRYGSQATLRKKYIGPVTNYYAKIGVGEFKSEAETLNTGDKFLIIGPTSGIIQGKVSELRVDDQPIDSVTKGQYFSMPIRTKVRPSDKLYKLVAR